MYGKVCGVAVEKILELEKINKEYLLRIEELELHVEKYMLYLRLNRRFFSYFADTLS